MAALSLNLIKLHTLLLLIASIPFVHSEENVEVDLVCPPVTQISPCSCSILSHSAAIAIGLDKQRMSVGCSFSATQKSIDRLLPAIRAANNLTSSNKILHISFFCILDTQLVTLDLNSLGNAHVEFDTLVISRNRHLKSIQVPEDSNKNFSVGYAFLESHPELGDEAIGNFLQFVRPQEQLKGLWLTGNGIKGRFASANFLPGLSTFVGLKWLHLERNKIKKIEGGQFRKNRALTILDLSNNSIGHIGLDAFLFDEDHDHEAASTLSINLDDNLLADQLISSRHGLQSNKGTVKFVSLQRNQFEYISDTNFKESLMGGSILELDMTGNRFICDRQRMGWLQAARGSLERKVLGVDCQNQEGKTIFTADLLDSSLKNRIVDD